MGKSDQELLEAKERRRRMLELAIEQMPQRIFWKDRELRYLGCNQAFARDAGFDSPAEVVGKDDFAMPWKLSADSYRADDREVMETGQAKIDFEEPQSKPDGSVVWLRTSKVALRDLAGEVIGVLGTYADATGRRNRELALEKTMGELERSNRELQQFAYVASHDLQEPLRMVSSFLTLLADRYGDQLDDRAREYIQVATNGASRMQQLIDDLLQYSRIDTRGKPFAPTDCSRILREVLDTLKVSIEEAGATVTFDKLPTIPGDASQLAQLFQNLLGNALKFRRDEPPRIHVGLEEQLLDWIFSVRDNGIGIAPKYFDRVFVIFQRLHSRSKYQGTGIGLAICKKILERHGGRIWVESQLGQGSTFKFSIPKSGLG